MTEVVNGITIPLGVAGLVVYATSIFVKRDYRHYLAIAAMAVIALTALSTTDGIIDAGAAVSVAALFMTVFPMRSRLSRPQQRAVGGVVLFGVLGAGWVVWPAMWIAVLYLMRGRGGRRCGAANRHTIDLRKRFQAPERPSTPSPVVTSTAVTTPTLAAYATDKRLPKDARDRLAELDRRCREALAYLREHDLDGGRLGFEVEQVQNDFAPTAVKSYLALPPSMADTIVVDDGKTGRQLLVEQLDLLVPAVDRVMAEAAKRGSEQIIASHRFLKNKFGETDQDLAL